MVSIRKAILVTALTVVAGVSASVSPALGAKPPVPWVSVADESPLDPSYDVMWGGYAEITASGGNFVLVECNNPTGHLMWRSETIDLSVSSTILMFPHPSEGDYYFPCVAKLLSNNQRKTIATDNFIMHSV